MLSSVEQARFRLCVPRAQYADHVRLYRCLAAPFARKRSRMNNIIGFVVGAMIGGSIAVAGAYWSFWEGATLVIDTDRSDRPIVLEGVSFWICAFAIFVTGALAAAVAYVRASRRMLRNMYELSRREPSDWTLLIGDSGLQTFRHTQRDVCRFVSTNGLPHVHKIQDFTTIALQISPRRLSRAPRAPGSANPG